MTGKTFRLRRWGSLAAASVLLAVASGCSSAAPGGDQKSSAETRATSAAESSGSDNPGIDLQCDADLIQKAPAPFHWSFKKVVPPMTNADWEADVTPNSIAGKVVDGSGTRAIHAARTDGTSWNTAMMILSGPLPASTFALVNNSSAMVRAGVENVNGEDAIKYAIDTSQDTPADASLIRGILGANGWVKGAAWVTRTGCPVKFVVDVQEYFRDGASQKEHYEANVTKP
jgi:hypothetical protein